MQRAFNVIIERDADVYYIASVPELGGCHTQANQNAEAVSGALEENCLHTGIFHRRTNTSRTRSTGPWPMPPKATGSSIIVSPVPEDAGHPANSIGE